MREILREGDIAIWDSTTLLEAREVKAIVSFKSGQQLITAEQYGKSFSALAIYDSRSLERERVLVLPEATAIPYILTVVPDSETVMMNIDSSLCLTNLQSRMVEANVFRMRYYVNQPKWWQIPFKEKDWFDTGHIEMFDEGKLMVAYCGRSSHLLPDYLLSWESSSNRLIKGPVYTLQNYSYYCSHAKIGAADQKRRQYITTDRLGTVKFWNVDDLSLDRQWKVPSAEDMTLAEPASGNNSLNIMTVCSEKNQLAVGTWYGPVHIVDIVSGEQAIAPLIAQDSEFKENTPYSNYYYDSKEKQKEVTTLRFFAKGSRLIVAHGDGSIRIWNTESGEQEGDTSYCPESSFATNILILPNENQAVLILKETYSLPSNILLFDLVPYLS